MRTGVSSCPSSMARQPGLTFSGSTRSAVRAGRDVEDAPAASSSCARSTSRRVTPIPRPTARATGPQGQPRGGVLVRRDAPARGGCRPTADGRPAAGERERGAVQHRSDRPGHRGRVDPPVDLELRARARTPRRSCGRGRSGGPGPPGSRSSSSATPTGREPDGGGCVEPDHQPPGPHRGEASPGPDVRSTSRVWPALPVSSASRRRHGRPARGHDPEGAQLAAVRPAQPQRRAGVARRGRPEADRIAVEGQLRAQVGLVPVGRGRPDAGVLQDRLQQPLRRGGGRGRPPRRRSSNSRPRSR